MRALARGHMHALHCQANSAAASGGSLAVHASSVYLHVSSSGMHGAYWDCSLVCCSCCCCCPALVSSDAAFGTGSVLVSEACQALTRLTEEGTVRQPM